MNLAHEHVLTSALPQSHLLQFYGSEDQALNKNVGRYLAEGLKFGGAIVIGSKPRNKAVGRQINELGIDSERAEQEGRLSLLDAEATLNEFMVDGQPYWGRFENTIGSAIKKIRTNVGHGGLRAYGEMVGVLWSAGQYTAAIRLEQFWNKLLSRSSASLFCGYPIDIFSPAFQTGSVDALLSAHTHMLPSDQNPSLQTAIHIAMDSVLGSKASELQAVMNSTRQPAWAAMPKAEASVLWIRNHLPERADEILARVRQLLTPISTACSDVSAIPEIA